MCRHVLVRRSAHDVSSKDIFVVSSQGLEEKENRNLSDAFALEQVKQNELPGLDLEDASSYIQRLPKKKAARPEFIAEFEELGVKYVLLHEKGVSQWYFDNFSTDKFAGLPPNPLICHHGFFSEDLVPITLRTVRNIAVLYDAAGIGLACKAQPTHQHYKIHIYLKLDMAMCGPSGAGTKYMMLTVCEHTMLTELFRGAGGEAAAKDEHLLRNFSWGNSRSEIAQNILMTGEPLSYSFAKDADIAVNKCGWAPDDGIVWLYSCRLVRNHGSRF